MRELRYTDSDDRREKRVDVERIEKIVSCDPAARAYASGCRSVIFLEAQGIAFRRAQETVEELERRMHAPPPKREPAKHEAERWSLSAALGEARQR